MHSVLLTVVVIAASCLGAFMAIPQAAQLLRSREVEGVSPAWAAMGATTNLWWIIYGAGIGDWAIIPVSVVSVAAYVVVAGALLRYGTAPGNRLPTLEVFAKAAIGIGALPLIGLLFGGWTLAGLVLGTVYGVQLTPAVATVYRSADVRGVSKATWALAWLEAFFWGIYSLGHADPGVGMMAFTGVIMSSAVLARLFLRRPKPLPGRRPAFST